MPNENRCMTEAEYQRYVDGLAQDGIRPIGDITIIPTRPDVPIDWDTNPYDSTGSSIRFWLPTVVNKSNNGSA